MLRVERAHQFLVANLVGRLRVPGCPVARHTLNTQAGRDWFTTAFHGPSGRAAQVRANCTCRADAAIRRPPGVTCTDGRCRCSGRVVSGATMRSREEQSDTGRPGRPVTLAHTGVTLMPVPEAARATLSDTGIRAPW